jgi:hypothetical protein
MNHWIEKLRDVLLTWRDRARSTKHRRLLADQSITEQSERSLRNAFDIWRGVMRERQLAGTEAEVVLRREDGLLFSVWDIWTSRSTVGIHHDTGQVGGTADSLNSISR